MTTFERNKTEAQSQVKFVQIPGSKFGSKICVSDSVKLDLMSKAWTQSQRENNFFNTHTHTNTHTNTLSLLHTKHTHTCISLLHTLFLSHHTHTYTHTLSHTRTFLSDGDYSSSSRCFVALTNVECCTSHESQHPPPPVLVPVACLLLKTCLRREDFFKRGGETR